MNKLGLSVPPGFTISTDVCHYYYQNKKNYPNELNIQVNGSIKEMEENLSFKFGRYRLPFISLS